MDTSDTAAGMRAFCANLISNDPPPVARTMSAAAYERLVDDIRECSRAYLRAQGFERPSRRLLRRAFLDAWLAEMPRPDALHSAIGHLRDAERFAPGSEDEADCINDFAAAAHRAAREHGRDGL